jgi:CO/xanthine dehydrogenase Mo-binding subunit
VTEEGESSTDRCRIPLPVYLDVPEIEVIYTDIPDERTPLGAHGIGQIGITAVGAAVANAVFHANLQTRSGFADHQVS